MFDHCFIPHHKFSVTSLFLFQTNVKNKNASLDFVYGMTAMRGNGKTEKKEKERKGKNEKCQ